MSSTALSSSSALSSMPAWSTITNADGSVTATAATGVGIATNNYQIVVVSPSNTETTVTKPLGDKRVSPRLYFKYVKSKLKKHEVKNLKIRLAKLQALTRDAFEIGQQALYEEYAKMINILVRESEAAVCGFDRWLENADIEKYMSITKGPEDKKPVVFFKKLEDFPRSVPFHIKGQITTVKSKGLFDQLWVLYLDYSGEVLKTNKEKIREKDPILFGQFKFAPNKYFYICDWTDEFCDLTLSSFVDTVKSKDPTYELNKVREIDKGFIEQIKKEVKEREDRLAITKPSNFRDLMTEEDKARLKKGFWNEVNEMVWQSMIMLLLVVVCIVFFIVVCLKH